MVEAAAVLRRTACLQRERCIESEQLKKSIATYLALEAVAVVVHLVLEILPYAVENRLRPSEVAEEAVAETKMAVEAAVVVSASAAASFLRHPFPTRPLDSPATSEAEAAVEVASMAVSVSSFPSASEEESAAALVFQAAKEEMLKKRTQIKIQIQISSISDLLDGGGGGGANNGGIAGIGGASANN